MSTANATQPKETRTLIMEPQMQTDTKFNYREMRPAQVNIYRRARLKTKYNAYSIYNKLSKALCLWGRGGEQFLPPNQCKSEKSSIKVLNIKANAVYFSLPDHWKPLLIVTVCTTVSQYIATQWFNLYKSKKHTLLRNDSSISLLSATGLTLLNKSLFPTGEEYKLYTEQRLLSNLNLGVLPSAVQDSNL